MICTPSDCPPASEIDMPAMRAKYLRERDRRIKKEFNDQYVDASNRLNVYSHTGRQFFVGLRYTF